MAKKGVKKKKSSRATKKSSIKSAKSKSRTKKSTNIKTKSSGTEKIEINKKGLRKTTKSLIYSAIVFIISLFLYVVIPETVYIDILFGLIMIFSGALVLLFVIIEIVYYFSKR